MSYPVILKFRDGETKVLTIDLSKPISMILSKFPVTYRDMHGDTKQFFPMQTKYTMTNGDLLYANSFLSASITETIMKNKEVIAGKKTITLIITRKGKDQQTRYEVKP